MAPARSSTRHSHIDQNSIPQSNTHEQDSENVNSELFIDPMLGTPLAMYIEKDVDDRETIAGVITKHGGTISTGYSGVTYILVDPHKLSGQNLWRMYYGKKGKVVLNARWIDECVKTNQLQTFQNNWAGCKVTGTEVVTPVTDQPTGSAQDGAQQTTSRRTRARQARETPAPAQPTHEIPQQQPQQPQPQPHSQPPPAQPMPSMAIDPLAHASFPYGVFRPMPPPHPQTWQTSGVIAPQQTHLAPHLLHRPPDTWDGYDPAAHGMGPPPGPQFEYRYREDQGGWVPTSNYYDTAYEQTYEQATYMEDPNAPNPVAGPSTAPSAEPVEKPRGRKRTRTNPPPGAPASTLVLNRNPPARSPTPPTRVIKSTYGGNLFTSDDVLYLKKYIDYCQEQGLVLSLREICERIAVKAPHHTFYSWRRYCNKHQIRLGGYVMNPDRSESPMAVDGGNQDIDEEEMIHNGPGPGIVAAAHQQQHRTVIDPSLSRNRSPTPPRALYRSTTGKGVAFTDEDTAFLVKFMEYRKSQGRLDMVAFWKDVASKAPHHSRASWMKFWRRHKHELTHSDADAPLPQPPDKKMRYSRDDDILLAKYFFGKPEGTSDKIFQAFGRVYPHHPWKGWQEHHRIHKAKIDHFMALLANGETLDGPQPPPAV